MGGIVLAAAIGYGIGQVLQMNYKPPKIDSPAQTIQDIQTQTSSEGGAQPIIFGVARPVGGNLIWQTKATKKQWKEVVGRVRVKKSFPSGKNKYEPVYQEYEEIIRSYAIRICRGPGVEVLRVWKNGKLVYSIRDMDAGEWDSANNDKFLEKATFYSGEWNQMPDPHMQSHLGHGQVPGYRGLAYMVVEEDYLTDYRGAMPQYTFEVARSPGPMLTTKMYDPVWEDGGGSRITGGSVSIDYEEVPWNEYGDVGLDANKADEVSVTLTFESTQQEINEVDAHKADDVSVTLTFEDTTVVVEEVDAHKADDVSVALSFADIVVVHEQPDNHKADTVSVTLSFEEK